MIEYAKTILPRFSYSESLFKKELMTCLRWAKPHEINELKAWCILAFYHQFPHVLDDVFTHIAA